MRLFLAALLVPLASGLASACPFCQRDGAGFFTEVAQSDFVVLGTVQNAKRDLASGDLGRGTTELVIGTVVKPHPYLAGKKQITLPRYIPADPRTAGGQFLVFCSLYTRPADVAAAAVVSTLGIASSDFAALDAVRGDPVAPDSKIAEYLTGAIAVRAQDSAARLKYFFNYLDAADLLIGTDALNEFAGTEYPDVRKAAPSLSPDRLRKWIADPGTPTSRIGLYGLLLGHSGTADDAKLLRKLLDDPNVRFASGRDGLMAGYTLLDPKAGYEFMMGQINAPGADFQQMYKTLDALKFFHDYRPDVVAKPLVLAGVKALVGKPEIADLPVETLRKWGTWDETDFVLSFVNSPAHMKQPITRRAVLRFALAAPLEKKAAKEYVERVRREDPERVKYVEQTLADEQTPPKPSDPASAPVKTAGAGAP